MTASHKAAIFAVVGFCLALFSFVPIAHASQDSADQMCQVAGGTWVYDEHERWASTFVKNNNTYFNLYGTYCKDETNGKIAAKGHCIEPKKCLATACDGEACKKSDVPVDQSKNQPNLYLPKDQVKQNPLNNTSGNSNPSPNAQPLPAPGRSVFDSVFLGTTPGGFENQTPAPSASKVEQSFPFFGAEGFPVGEPTTPNNSNTSPGQGSWLNSIKNLFAPSSPPPTTETTDMGNAGTPGATSQTTGFGGPEPTNTGPNGSLLQPSTGDLAMAEKKIDAVAAESRLQDAQARLDSAKGNLGSAEGDLLTKSIKLEMDKANFNAARASADAKIASLGGIQTENIDQKTGNPLTYLSSKAFNTYNSSAEKTSLESTAKVYEQSNTAFNKAVTTYQTSLDGVKETQGNYDSAKVDYTDTREAIGKYDFNVPKEFIAANPSVGKNSPLVPTGSETLTIDAGSKYEATQIAEAYNRMNAQLALNNAEMAAINTRLEAIRTGKWPPPSSEGSPFVSPDAVIENAPSPADKSTMPLVPSASEIPQLQGRLSGLAADNAQITEGLAQLRSGQLTDTLAAITTKQAEQSGLLQGLREVGQNTTDWSEVVKDWRNANYVDAVAKGYANIVGGAIGGVAESAATAFGAPQNPYVEAICSNCAFSERAGASLITLANALPAYDVARGIYGVGREIASGLSSELRAGYGALVGSDVSSSINAGTAATREVGQFTGTLGGPITGVEGNFTIKTADVLNSAGAENVSLPHGAVTEGSGLWNAIKDNTLLQYTAQTARAAAVAAQLLFPGEISTSFLGRAAYDLVETNIGRSTGSALFTDTTSSGVSDLSITSRAPSFAGSVGAEVGSEILDPATAIARNAFTPSITAPSLSSPITGAARLGYDVTVGVVSWAGSLTGTAVANPASVLPTNLAGSTVMPEVSANPAIVSTAPEVANTPAPAAAIPGSPQPSAPSPVAETQQFPSPTLGLPPESGRGGAGYSSGLPVFLSGILSPVSFLSAPFKYLTDSLTAAPAPPPVVQNVPRVSTGEYVGVVEYNKARAGLVSKYSINPAHIDTGGVTAPGYAESLNAAQNILDQAGLAQRSSDQAIVRKENGEVVATQAPAGKPQAGYYTLAAPIEQPTPAPIPNTASNPGVTNPTQVVTVTQTKPLNLNEPTTFEASPGLLKNPPIVESKTPVVPVLSSEVSASPGVEAPTQAQPSGELSNFARVAALLPTLLWNPAATLPTVTAGSLAVDTVFSSSAFSKSAPSQNLPTNVSPSAQAQTPGATPVNFIDTDGTTGDAIDKIGTRNLDDADIADMRPWPVESAQKARYENVLKTNNLGGMKWAEAFELLRTQPGLFKSIPVKDGVPNIAAADPSKINIVLCDTPYICFASVSDAVAMAHAKLTYQGRYKNLQTYGDVIKVWVGPDSINPNTDLAQHLARTGLSAGQKIDRANPDTMAKLTLGIFQGEYGAIGNYGLTNPETSVPIKSLQDVATNEVLRDGFRKIYGNEIADNWYKAQGTPVAPASGIAKNPLPTPLASPKDLSGNTLSAYLGTARLKPAPASPFTLSPQLDTITSKGQIPTFAEIQKVAKLSGKPDIPGLNVVYLAPLGDVKNPSEVTPRKFIVLHQTETSPGTAQGQAEEQSRRPNKTGATIWVETDGTVYWSTPENTNPGHLQSNRMDNKYLDNSKTYKVVTNANAIGIEFAGNGAPIQPGVSAVQYDKSPAQSAAVKQPLTQAQMRTLSILVPFLQERYGISSDQVYAHNWVSMKDERYCEGCNAATFARNLAYVPGQNPNGTPATALAGLTKPASLQVPQPSPQPGTRPVPVTVTIPVPTPKPPSAPSTPPTMAQLLEKQGIVSPDSEVLANPDSTFDILNSEGAVISTIKPIVPEKTVSISFDAKTNYTMATLRGFTNVPALNDFLEAAGGNNGFSEKRLPDDRFIRGDSLAVLLDVLKEYKAKFGVLPTINGIGRSAAVNREVGGVLNSDHLSGTAIDFCTSGCDESSEHIQGLIKILEVKDLSLVTVVHGEGPHTHASVRRDATPKELANLTIKYKTPTQYALFDPTGVQIGQSFAFSGPRANPAPAPTTLATNNVPLPQPAPLTKVAEAETPKPAAPGAPKPITVAESGTELAIVWNIPSPETFASGSAVRGAQEKVQAIQDQITQIQEKLSLQWKIQAAKTSLGILKAGNDALGAEIKRAHIPGNLPENQTAMDKGRAVIGAPKDAKDAVPKDKIIQNVLSDISTNPGFSQLKIGSPSLLNKEISAHAEKLKTLEKLTLMAKLTAAREAEGEGSLLIKETQDFIARVEAAIPKSDQDIAQLQTRLAGLQQDAERLDTKILANKSTVATAPAFASAGPVPYIYAPFTIAYDRLATGYPVKVVTSAPLSPPTNAIAMSEPTANAQPETPAPQQTVAKASFGVPYTPTIVQYTFSQTAFAPPAPASTLQARFSTAVRRPDEPQVQQGAGGAQPENAPAPKPLPPAPSLAEAAATRAKYLQDPVTAVDGFKNFPRLDLASADAELQEASIAKYLSNEQGLFDDYRAHFGDKVVNPDLARLLFRDIGYNGTNASAVQKVVADMTERLWRDNLATNPGKYAVIYTGSSGAGKSSTVEAFLSGITSDAAAILDGTLSNQSVAKQRIAEALAAGKSVQVINVYRDPIDAWNNGVIARMNGDSIDAGRAVPVSVFVVSYKRTLDIVKSLLDDPQVEVTLIDNSKGSGNQTFMRREEFLAIKYSSSIERTIRDDTKNLLDTGVITPEQYVAITGSEAPAKLALASTEPIVPIDVEIPAPQVQTPPAPAASNMIPFPGNPARPPTTEVVAPTPPPATQPATEPKVTVPQWYSDWSALMQDAEQNALFALRPLVPGATAPAPPPVINPVPIIPTTNPVAPTPAPVQESWYQKISSYFGGKPSEVAKGAPSSAPTLQIPAPSIETVVNPPAPPRMPAPNINKATPPEVIALPGPTESKTVVLPEEPQAEGPVASGPAPSAPAPAAGQPRTITLPEEPQIGGGNTGGGGQPPQPPTPPGGGTTGGGATGGGSSLGWRALTSTGRFCTNGWTRFGVCAVVGSVVGYGIYSVGSDMWNSLWTSGPPQGAPKVPPVVITAQPPPQKPPGTPIPRGRQVSAPDGTSPGGNGSGLSPGLMNALGQVLGQLLAKMLGQPQQPAASTQIPPSAPTSTQATLTPVVTLIASPTVVASGTKATLIWSSVGVSGCSVFAQGGAQFAEGVNGATSTPPLATTTVFSAQCTATGVSIGATTTIRVQ